MATACNVYAFDCGTTNWRICRLSCREMVEDGGTRKLQPVSEPQVVALTTFTSTGHSLPAALLLDTNGRVQSYGQNVYDLAREPARLPYLRDAFKLCIGNCQLPVALNPLCRYTHEEALIYTQLLLSQVIEQLEREKPGSLAKGSGNLFFFAHPVHWGCEKSDGQIEGQILADFAGAVRRAFPAEVRDKSHFVPEPEGALVSLMQSGQLATVGSKFILVDAQSKKYHSRYGKSFGQCGCSKT